MAGPFETGNEAPRAPTPAVAREIHTQAVRDQFASVMKRLPVWLVTIALWGGVAHWRFSTLAFVFVAVAGVWTASAFIGWLNLRNQDAVAAVHAERLQAHEEGQHEARVQSTTLFMTYGLIGAITAVGIFQIITGGVDRSVATAGLVKPAVKAGQWWRLLTCTYLHGFLWHFWGNVAALRALGASIEIYDRRLRLPLVYLISAIGGSLASTAFNSHASIGASGGIMGLCGYLLIFAMRRPGVAPPWLRTSMSATLTNTAILGLIGFFFIDNFAHAGGALTGAACGALMVRGDTDPESLERDRLLDALGWVAAAILVGGAGFTVRKMIVP